MIHIKSITKTMTISQLAQLCLDAFFANHELSKDLINDRCSHFMILFQKNLFSFFKTKLAIFTTYHNQIDDQTEIVNMTLEYMLRHSY